MGQMTVRYQYNMRINLVGGASQVTWDPLNKHADLVLSNGNLTAGYPIGNDANSFPPLLGWPVRATTPVTAGQLKYWELQVVLETGGYLSVGVASAAWALDGIDWLGSGNTTDSGLGWYTEGGIYPLGDVPLPAFAEGDRLKFAVRYDDNSFFFKKNGGDWNDDPLADPATNTGGASLADLIGKDIYPAFFSSYVEQGSPDLVGSTVTAHFASSSWQDAAPAGFSAIGES